MTSTPKQELLRKLPSVSKLLENPAVAGWLAEHPRTLVTDCLRRTLEDLRRQIREDSDGRCGPAHASDEYVLQRAGERLLERTRPQLRPAINATGIILHTGLGRSVYAQSVLESMLRDLKGYVTLAVDRDSGDRSERDQRVEYILCELTGAEAATVVNNNAAATLLALAALAAGREVIVSRGQLIEIGGAFRLPDVMDQSGCKLVEVGTTNRTHRRDYQLALTDATAAILRVHPSNYRVVGFTAEVGLEELVELAHARGLVLIDDLGAGALLDLEQFGLPHEPTLRQSVQAGADVVLASADKLIGASQGGIIVGRKDPIERIRRHPLARACRVDKSCLMALERTLMLFRDPARLAREHPIYRMLTTPPETLARRGEALAAAIRQVAGPAVKVDLAGGVGYLGSGSLPMHELPTTLVRLQADNVKPAELARRLRTDEHAVFARVEDERVVMDVRTVTDEQVEMVAQAVGRATA